MSLQTKLSLAALSTVTTLTAATTLMPAAQAAILGQYTFGPAGGFTSAATNVDPNLTFSNFTVGNGLSFDASTSNSLGTPASSFVTEGWNEEASDFVGFTVTPATGASYSLSSLSFDAFLDTTSSNPLLRLLVGPVGSLTQVATFTFTGGFQTFNADLSAFANQTAPLEFRFTVSVVTAGTLGLDNVILQGSATSGPTGPTVPTPALLPGLIGMGIAAWRKRKGEAAAETEV